MCALRQYINNGVTYYWRRLHVNVYCLRRRISIFIYFRNILKTHSNTDLWRSFKHAFIYNYNRRRKFVSDHIRWIDCGKRLQGWIVLVVMRFQWNRPNNYGNSEFSQLSSEREPAKLVLGIKCRQSCAGRFSPSYTLGYSVWPCEYVPAASVEDNEQEVKDNGLSSYSINTGFSCQTREIV